MGNIRLGIFWALPWTLMRDMKIGVYWEIPFTILNMRVVAFWIIRSIQNRNMRVTGILDHTQKLLLNCCIEYNQN